MHSWNAEKAALDPMIRREVKTCSLIPVDCMGHLGYECLHQMRME